MWSAIQYVGTGLSLIAFIVAAALFAYRARLKQRALIIEKTPHEERVKAIAATAEFFNVDVAGLPAKQQQQIVLAQIRLRARRELLFALVSLAVAILLAVIAIVTIILTQHDGLSKGQIKNGDLVKQCYRFDAQSAEQLEPLGLRTCLPGRIVYVKYWDPTDYHSSWPNDRPNRVLQARGPTGDGAHVEWVEQNLISVSNRLENWGTENHYWVSVIENTGIGRGMNGFVLRRVDLQPIPLGQGGTQCDSVDNKRDIFEFAIPRDVIARISGGTKPTVAFRRLRVSCSQEIGFNQLPGPDFEDTGMPIVRAIPD